MSAKLIFFTTFANSTNVAETMKKLFAISIFLMAAFSSAAQSDTFLESDEHSARLFDSVMFVNRNYNSGIVVFKDNKQSTGTMNICTIDQKVYFITPDKDTLVLKDNDNVNRVFIKGKTYINTADGYVEILDMTDDLCLGRLQKIELLNNVQTGAYGQKRQNATIQNVNYIDAGGFRIDLGSGRVKPFIYTRTPLLYKANGAVLSVTKKNLIKCFPKKKEFIEAYLQEHKTNLNAVEPVQELFKALSGK